MLLIVITKYHWQSSIIAAVQLRLSRSRPVATPQLWGLRNVAATACGSQRGHDLHVHRRHRLCGQLLWLLRCLGTVALPASVGKCRPEVKVSFKLNSISPSPSFSLSLCFAVLHVDRDAVHERVPCRLHCVPLPRRPRADSGKWAALWHWATLQCQRSWLSGGALCCCNLG